MLLCAAERKMTMNSLNKDFYEKLKGIYTIHPETYEKYDVKRGLRNKDGTGVLVGLTSIGDVRGYIIEEKDKINVPGKLTYRGINMVDIVKENEKRGQHAFEETVYLILMGELPTKDELKEFKEILAKKRELPRGFTEDMILKAPSPNIMNKLARAVLASYSYDENPDSTSIENLVRQSIELISRFPSMVSYGYQAKKHYYDGDSLFLHSPLPEYDTAQNFLHMIRKDNKFTELEASVLDLLLVIHAEHGGGNNSSFATHVVSSSGTDTYSAIAAAVGSLKGPRHGGANAKVIGMIDEIKACCNWKDEGALKDYLVKIVNKEAYDKSGLVYGMGHAIYTLSDPRAELLKEKAEHMAAETGREKEFELYKRIEALTPGIFNEIKGNKKHLCANVDLYSGFVYSMLGIPEELYTPLFAIARVPSWCAHRMEEIVAGGKIIRPAYKSVSIKRSYTPIEER